MARALIAAAALLLVVTGCTTPWQEAAKNVENAKRLRVGQTKEEVLEIMGEPLSGETYCTPDRWFYYIESVWSDGLVTEDECMPLIFEEGKLVGFGRLFYTQYRLRARNNAQEVTQEPDATAAAQGTDTGAAQEADGKAAEAAADGAKPEAAKTDANAETKSADEK